MLTALLKGACVISLAQKQRILSSAGKLMTTRAVGTVIRSSFVILMDQDSKVSMLSSMQGSTISVVKSAMLHDAERQYEVWHSEVSADRL